MVVGQDESTGGQMNRTVIQQDLAVLSWYGDIALFRPALAFVLRDPRDLPEAIHADVVHVSEMISRSLRVGCPSVEEGYGPASQTHKTRREDVPTHLLAHQCL